MPKPLQGELALIDLIRSRAANRTSRTLPLGIGDDCAILTPPRGHDLLVTTDLSLETRHFRLDWHSPQSIGHRTLARGLSDLAAMGATPLAAFLSLALPKQLARNTRFLNHLLDGLLTLARLHKVPLAGGDTSESPLNADGSPGHLLADIVLLGSAPHGRALRRSTARPGDLLYVTGSLGGASTELAALSTRTTSRNPLVPYPLSLVPASPNPHLFPAPRLTVGQTLLRRRLATACIDLSDGLSTDLTHLCEASNVSAELDIAALPAHPLTTQLSPAAQIAAILHGGEDYELLFTASPATKLPRSIAGVPITPIGRILKPHKSRARITVLSDDTRFDLHPQGWQHLT